MAARVAWEVCVPGVHEECRRARTQVAVLPIRRAERVEKVARGFFGVQKRKKVKTRVVPGILFADLMCSCRAKVATALS
jgi:hypothetical protein